MSYVWNGSAPATGVLTIEQMRRRNAELNLELRALTAEHEEINDKIRLMRDELTVAYRKLRKQVQDLETVRVQEQLIAESKTYESQLPPPRFGGREGLEAATEEMLAHESKALNLKKVTVAKGPSHGTRRCYESGCRCTECRENHTLRSSRYRSNQKLRTPQKVAA